MNKYKVWITVSSLWEEQIIEANSREEALEIAYNNIEYDDGAVLLEEGEEEEDD